MTSGFRERPEPCREIRTAACPRRAAPATGRSGPRRAAQHRAPRPRPGPGRWRRTISGDGHGLLHGARHAAFGDERERRVRMGLHPLGGQAVSDDEDRCAHRMPPAPAVGVVELTPAHYERPVRVGPFAEVVSARLGHVERHRASADGISTSPLCPGYPASLALWTVVHDARSCAKSAAHSRLTRWQRKPVLRSPAYPALVHRCPFPASGPAPPLVDAETTGTASWWGRFERPCVGGGSPWRRSWFRGYPATPARA